MNTFEKIIDVLSKAPNTINGLAEQFSMDRTIIMYCVKVLEHDNLIVAVGKVPARGGKGKPAISYGIPK